jgi:NTP pyrophosphatase (non-canonical NTP hydrolase)
MGGEKSAATRETVAITFARLAEEVGEVAEAIDSDERVDGQALDTVRNEMADLLAWVLALANLFHNIDPRFQAIALADVAWERYPGMCWRCRERPCHCVRGEYQAELASRGAMAPSHWDERTGWQIIVR